MLNRGSRRQVWNGTARKTSGGLTKKDLSKSKGRIILRKSKKTGKTFKRRSSKKGGKRKKKKKAAEKAQDAGARARRKLARKVHATYVSGSEDNVPDDIRDHKTWKDFRKNLS